MLKPSGFLLPPLSGGSLVDGVVSSEELVGRRRLYREELSSMLPSPPSTWSSPGLGGKWLGAHWNPLCPREGAHSCGGGCHHCRCRRRRCCCCRRHWTNFTSTFVAELTDMVRALAVHLHVVRNISRAQHLATHMTWHLLLVSDCVRSESILRSKSCLTFLTFEGPLC